VTKRNGVVAALVVFALWPLAHRALVAALDLNPWRFSGWAMYATPIFPKRIYLFQVDPRAGAAAEPVEVPESQWSSAMRHEARRYAVRRTNLGRLAGPPDQLGQLAVSEHGATGMIAVVVQNRRLNLTTGLIETSVENYGYSSATRVNP
jgi:hypothetical protein